MDPKDMPSDDIRQIINDLADEEKPPINKQLVELTDIKASDLVFFDQVWQTLNPERKLQIINRLTEMAEDLTEVNFDAIFRHRLYDPEPEIRTKAIEGLWESEDSSLIKPFIKLMQTDPSLEVRRASTMALGKFAMLAENKKLAPDYMPILCKTLLETYAENNDMELKRRALEAVAPLSLPRVEQAITEAYNSDDIKLKASALYAMGRNCKIDWINDLIRELSAPIAELRYEAAGACGELAEDTAVPYLIEAAEDNDINVRLAAIIALGKIGGEEAQEYLKACLEDEGETVREAAQHALDDIDIVTHPGSFRWTDLEE
ncbi:MAG: HEAT repeat domain-containing protein [Dehalococcoidales bacterium]